MMITMIILDMARRNTTEGSFIFHILMMMMMMTMMMMMMNIVMIMMRLRRKGRMWERLRRTRRSPGFENTRTGE